MAVSLLGYDVSDLCLGKPPIRSLPATSALSHALSSLSHSGDPCLSVWSCSHSDGNHDGADCRCLGKVGMVDIICFLCRPDNISHPISALSSPLSVLLPPFSALVRHVEPHCSLMEALELFLEGAQNLVVPITPHHRRGKAAVGRTWSPAAVSGKQYCWLMQENMVRFLLNSITHFSSISVLSIDALGIVMSDGVLAVGYHDWWGDLAVHAVHHPRLRCVGGAGTTHSLHLQPHGLHRMWQPRSLWPTCLLATSPTTAKGALLSLPS